MRLFLDVTTAYEFESFPSNKFSRMHRLLADVFPEAITGRITSRGFSPESYVSRDPDEPRVEYYLKAITRRPAWTIKKRLACHVKLPVLRLAAFLLSSTIFNDIIKHAGAYELYRCFDFFEERGRRIYFLAFEVKGNDKRHSAFRYWLRARIKEEYRPTSLPPASEPLVLDESDTVLLIALPHSVSNRHNIEAFVEVNKARIITFVLDCSPFFSPATLSSRHYRRWTASLAAYETFSNITYVSSASIQSILSTELDVRTPGSQVRVLRAPLYLSRRNECCLSPVSRPFILVVGAITNRIDHEWVVASWLEAKRKTNQTPSLIIAASRIDTFEKQSLQQLVSHRSDITLIETPTDSELNALYEAALFVIRPPSQGGYGTVLEEAIEFGKACLCEQHPAYQEIVSPIVIKVPLVYEAWTNAVISLSDEVYLNTIMTSFRVAGASYKPSNKQLRSSILDGIQH